jgi:hypothetical protein
MANPEDADKILAWSEANKARSHFDAQTLAYPLTEVVCAENGTEKLYVPVQLVGMIEALAPDPQAHHAEIRRALYLTLGDIVSKARQSGVRELYFVGTDPVLNVLAERVGFEELPWPVYRRKL